MTVFILNKVLMVIFLLCVLNSLKHIWNVISGLREEIPSKYQISTMERFLLGLSISYIITIIFTGLQL
jgi:hypothetical protein